MPAPPPICLNSPNVSGYCPHRASDTKTCPPLPSPPYFVHFRVPEIRRITEIRFCLLRIRHNLVQSTDSSYVTSILGSNILAFITLEYR